MSGDIKMVWHEGRRIVLFHSVPMILPKDKAREEAAWTDWNELLREGPVWKEYLKDWAVEIKRDFEDGAFTKRAVFFFRHRDQAVLFKLSANVWGD